MNAYQEADAELGLIHQSFIQMHCCVQTINTELQNQTFVYICVKETGKNPASTSNMVDPQCIAQFD